MSVDDNVISSETGETKLEIALDLAVKSSKIYSLHRRLCEKLSYLAIVMSNVVKSLQHIRKVEQELEVYRAAALQKVLAVDDQLGRSAKDENVNENK